MFQVNKLAKRFGLFLLVYFVLIIAFQWGPLEQAHNVYYSHVQDRIFNMINPNYYTDFLPTAPDDNTKGWNATIMVYNRAKHRGKISDKRYRKSVNPNRLFYRNFYELALLPFLFLIALFAVTPMMTWKRKIIGLLVCLLILYIFLSFHYSHIIENITINENVIGDSFWEQFVAIFGFKGLNEPLYLIALVSWGGFAIRPKLLEWVNEN